MRPRHILLLVTLGAASLVACGETRYVVVQTPAPGAAAAVAPTSTSAAASATTAAAPAAAPTDGDGTVAATTDDTSAATSATDAARDEGTTTVATAAAVPGPASAADEAGIKSAIEGALGFDTRGYAERSRFIDGATDLEPTMNAVLNVISGLDGGYDYQSITTDGDTAEAIVDVIVSGAPFSTGLPVELVQVDGEWKLTRAGACTIFSLASPCPDA